MKKFLILSFLLLFPLGAAKASGASLYLSPNSGTFPVGSTFDVSVFLDTGGNNVNAVKANLKFDPKKLQITNPTTGKSFISVWVAQPSYSNIQGIASFQGGVPSPGINTSSGLISTITFRVIAPGPTSISIDNSSQVLLNNGQGTDILATTGQGNYTLSIPPPEGPQISSPTHPDQNKWYKNNSPTFSWNKEEGVTDFSYTIDQDFSGVPDNVSNGSQTSVSYSNLSDGIWYFHVKAEKNGVWGGVSSYVVQIDTTPPAKFNIGFEPKLQANLYTSPSPIVTFITTDALSGIDHYELKIVNLSNPQGAVDSSFTEVTSPYSIPALPSGENEIIVRALDKAGNWQDSVQKIVVIPPGKLFYFTNSGVNIWKVMLPWWLSIILIIVLILIFALIIILSLRVKIKHKKKRNHLIELKERAGRDTWINT